MLKSSPTLTPIILLRPARRCWHPVLSSRPCPAGPSRGTRQASSIGASFLGSRSSELRCFGTERLPNNGFATGEPGSGGPPDRETVVGRPRRRALVSWTGGMGQRCCTPSTPTTKGVQCQFRRSVTRGPGSWASRGTSPSVAARSGGGTGPRWLRFSPLSEPRTGLACQANAFAITGESRRRSDCGPRCSQDRRRSLDVGVVLSPGRRLARGRKPGSRSSRCGPTRGTAHGHPRRPDRCRKSSFDGVVPGLRVACYLSLPVLGR